MYLSEIPLPGTKINWSCPISKGIVACWLLNENGWQAYDISGRNKHLSLTGNGFSSPPPRSTEGVNFLGTSSQHISNNITIIDGYGYPFTISAWYKMTTNGGAIFTEAKSSVDNVYYGIGLTASGQVQIFARNTTNFVTQSTKTSNDYRWHNITGVFKNETTRNIYLDGILEATGTDSATYNITVDRVSIGRIVRLTPTVYFNGKLRQIIIWRKALQAGEVKYYTMNPNCIFT